MKTNQFIAISEIGLENYLNQNYRDIGGYPEFVKRHIKLKEPKTVIARAFDVNRSTVGRWIDFFNKELEDAQQG